MRKSTSVFGGIAALGFSSVFVWGPFSIEQRKQEAAQNFPGLLAYELQDLSNLPKESQGVVRTTISLGGVDYVLNLRKHSMRSDDFRVLVPGGDGRLHSVEAPPVTTYRGNVEGLAESKVVGSLSEGLLSVEIDLGGGNTWQVQPVSQLLPGQANPSQHLIYRNDDVYLEGVYHCGSDSLTQPPTDKEPEAIGEGGGTAMALTGNKICDIALDADYEFFQNKHAGNLANCIRDMEDIMNRVETIYDVEVDIVYEVTTIVVRTSEPDPYTSTNPNTLLDQFRAEWNSDVDLGNDVRRDTAQLFTGKNIDGGVIGIAWLTTICASRTSGFGYSVVESRYTTILARRTALSAHELGHSWSAGHCDGQGDCGIMCSALCGCACDLTHFGVQETNSILNHKASRACLTDEQDVLTLNVFDDFPTTTLDIVKWSYNNNGVVNAAAVNEPSAPNSLNLNSAGVDAYQDDDVRTNFINLSGTSNIWLSYTTEHIGVEAGEQLFVDYWNNNLTWVTINTITSDGVDQSNFSYFTHLLPAAALHSEFRVRLRSNGNETNDNWYIDDVAVSRVKNLTVNSNPVGGVSVSVSPLDNSGLGSGSTSFVRTFNEGKAVSLTAPASAGGMQFFEWKLNGVSQGANPVLNLTADADKTASAEYKFVYELDVTSLPSGVTITVVPADNSAQADGVTPFSRNYWEGTSVTLTAPSTASGVIKFDRWVLDGVPQPRGVRIVNFDMGAARTAQAKYFSVHVAPALQAAGPIQILPWP